MLKLDNIVATLSKRTIIVNLPEFRICAFMLRPVQSSILTKFVPQNDEQNFKIVCQLRIYINETLNANCEAFDFICLFDKHLLVFFGFRPFFNVKIFSDLLDRGLLVNNSVS